MSIKKRPDIKSLDADAFIQGAAEEKPQAAPAAPKQATKQEEIFPWVEANPRVIRGINLRLPEPLWLKMDYIRRNTPLSMQGIIMQFLEREIDKQLKELTNK